MTIKTTIKTRIIICVFGCLTFFVAPGLFPGQLVSEQAVKGQEPQPSPDAGVSMAEPYVPLSQINSQADKIDRSLREITARHRVPITEDKVQAIEDQINAQAHQTEEILAASPTLYELRDLDTEWKKYKQDLAKQQKAMTGLVTTAETDLRFLKEEKNKWLNTLNHVTDPGALEVVYDRIKDTIFKIEDALQIVQERLSLLLAAQSRISQLDERLLNINNSIAEAKQSFQGRLLINDQPPIWSSIKKGNAGQTDADFSQTRLMRELAEAAQAINNQLGILLALFVFFILSLIGLITLNHERGRLTGEESDLYEESAILNRPVSIALLMTLLIQLLISPISVGGLNAVVSFLILIPVLRVIGLMVNPLGKGLLPNSLPRSFLGYAIAVFYVINQIRRVIDLNPLIERLIFFAEIALAIIVVYLILRSYRSPGPGSNATKLRLTALWAALVLLIVSELANAFGYLTLSKVVGDGTLLSAYLGLILFGSARIAIIIIKLLLRTDAANLLVSVKTNHELLDRWTIRICKFAVWGIWIVCTLDFFTVLDDVTLFAGRVLGSSLTLNALSISLGDVLAFIVVVAGAYFLSKLIRTFLQEDILGRMPLERGIPQAIATTIYYAILLLGFVLALLAAGFDLSKLTILTGAFGIGIGFGLQTIFNNFVSGLILLFERPVQIGDTVEIGGVTGQIKHIGIRSSTVQTFQGAEVIVPNSKLISDQFTNWTLSDQRRRIDIPVGVAYGTSPEKVQELLLKIARSHPDVLPLPEPLALFMGFGESALNFELRCWTSNDKNLIVKSQIAVAISEAFEKADIKIPSQQRVLYIVSEDGTPIEKRERETRETRENRE